MTKTYSCEYIKECGAYALRDNKWICNTMLRYLCVEYNFCKDQGKLEKKVEELK